MPIPDPFSPTESHRQPADQTPTETHLPAGHEPVVDGSTVTAGRPNPPQPTALPNIPGFTVVRRLGGGGMGEVYEVIHDSLGETFALKMIRTDKAGAGFRERFKHEALAMLKLEHPHIVRFYHYGEANGRPYITMRFIAGNTLSAHLPRLRNHIREAIAMIQKIADAVRYLHEQGMVHRDVKPSNVMIDAAGEPYLGDFGLVKIAMETDPLVGTTEKPLLPINASSGEPSPTPLEGDVWLTRSGALMGTLAYMSPEQTRGNRDSIGPPADCWALGVTIYELITGVRPFDNEYPDEQMRAINEQEPRHPTLVRPKTDPTLAKLSLECLRKNPAERCTAHRLTQELKRWLSRSRWKMILALGVGLIALAIVGYFLMKPAPAKELRAQTRSERLQIVRNELAKGNPVALLREDGFLAAPWEVTAGKDSTKTERTDEGWGVYANDTTLLEFLDDPGIDSYSLVAEMRARRLATIPEAGIFVASMRVADPQGDWRFLFKHIYRESPDNILFPPLQPPVAPIMPPAPLFPRTDRPGVRMAFFRGARFGPLGDSPYRVLEKPVAADAPAIGGPWRKLAIRVDKGDFFVAWEEKPEETINPAKQTDWLDFVHRHFKGLGDRPPERLSARGGCGLFLSGGSITLRSLWIYPE